jgi:hypothetical protein
MQRVAPIAQSFARGAPGKTHARLYSPLRVMPAVCHLSGPHLSGPGLTELTSDGNSVTLDPAWRQIGSVTADEYLNRILARELVNTGSTSPIRDVQATLMPLIVEWAGSVLLNVHPSGSFMKGTAVLSGTDIDLFISISENCTDTLKEVYEKLFRRLTERGYSPKRQNVSINIHVSGYSVDLVPAKRQNPSGTDHSLWRRRAETWTKTNVTTHIRHVIAAGRQQEIRIIKLWRNQKSLDFPSFYLELVVISALSSLNTASMSLERRVQAVFEFLRDSFSDSRIVDPANTNNVISDDLTAAQKQAISSAAKTARSAPTWGDIVK